MQDAIFAGRAGTGRRRPPVRRLGAAWRWGLGGLAAVAFAAGLGLVAAPPERDAISTDEDWRGNSARIVER